jgi:hypothetical protein
MCYNIECLLAYLEKSDCVELRLVSWVDLDRIRVVQQFCRLAL